MKINCKNQKGFTLVELLLFMGIFSILMVALFQLLTSIFDVQFESQSTAGVSQDGRFILNRLSYDIGKAISFTNPDIGSQSSTLQFSDGTKTLTYSLVNGNLTLASTPSGTVDELNSFNTSVSNVSFLRLADTSNKNDTITASFTITSKVIRRGETESQNFKTTVGIRQ